jgi:hypothetical protein
MLGIAFPPSFPAELQLVVGGSFGGSTGCGDDRLLSAQNSSAAVNNYSVSSNFALTLTNTTQETFPGDFVFYGGVSAFNPGGPEIGASVDDPSHEYALFSSKAELVNRLADEHSCDTRNYPGYPDYSDGGYYFSPFACGVRSLDETEFELDLGPLGPGETLTANFEILITAQLKSVPTPGTLPLFATGLGGLVLLRWRRTKKAVMLAAS